MSQRVSSLKGQGFGPEMNTRHCTSRNSRYNSDDPYQELKVLISRFTKNPSPEYPYQQSGEANRSKSVTSDSRGPPTKHCAQSQRRSTRSFSSPEPSKETSAMLPSSRTSSTRSTNHSIKASEKSPTQCHKPSPSPSLSKSKSKSPARERQAPTTRRSGRSRTGPTNYYKKLEIGDPDSDGDSSDENTRTRRRRDHVKNEPSPPPTHSPIVELNDACGLSCRTARKYGTLNRLLQGRELGHGVGRKLHNSLTQDFKLYKSWKGASNDVIVLAWSPDGTRFAAGATAQCDEHNMSYNRGNNLVLGNLANNSLRELPDHSIPRPTTALASNVTDPRLFMSVTAVQWFDDILFTASYDNTVKLWDVSKPQGKTTTCFKTLVHDSKVEVMARSNFNQNILATGTNSIGLWDIRESVYTPLDLPKKQRYGQSIDFVPTSLAWGTTPSSKDFLVAGMSEKEDGVPQNGLLAVWAVNEASIDSISVTPNSQNIFDIKWHPSLPVFATAGSAPFGRFMGRSVIRFYRPGTYKTSILEFDCPALDINDVTFCPTNPSYVTASCTDGVTYVWDERRPDTILHRLKHGTPINQIDENLPRDQADVGVRMALWGGGIDEFYSGASDGVVKRWNILQSPDDVHVKDMINFKEEIMCGTFTKDKTNLLIGDAAGGVHILSSNPWSGNEGQTMNFERGQCPDIESDSESGVKEATRLLSTMQLQRHPIYGIGKGPKYKGPYATWARPEGTSQDNVARTPLLREFQILQLDTSDRDREELEVPKREEIKAHIQLARYRNQQRMAKKRTREAVVPNEKGLSSENYINLCSDDEEEDIKSLHLPVKARRRIAKPKPATTILEPVFIDLTLDTEDDVSPSSNGDILPIKSRPIHSFTKEDLEACLEDDFWWPESGSIDPNLDNDD